MKNGGAILRNKILGLRDQLLDEERVYKSKIIAEKVLSLEVIQKSQLIFVYVSFRSEVSTLFLIDYLLKNNKKVAVPRTLCREKDMLAVEIEERKKDLVSGYCGIPEPSSSRCECNTVAREEIDAVLVPGSVFDRRGGRLGYGGGYYDRFLHSIFSTIRIGLAFDLQLINKAPLQVHDQIMDYIVTESEIIKGRDLRV